SFFIDKHRAWPTKLLPLGQEFAVGVKDLDAAVDTVGNEYPPRGIKGNSMRLIKLAGSRPLFAPRLDDLAVGCQLDNPRIGIAAVTVRDKDRAVRRDRHRRGPVEIARRIARHPGVAQSHQYLALGAELDDHVTLAVFAVGIGDIDVALLVDRDAVGKDEHPRA